MKNLIIRLLFFGYCLPHKDHRENRKLLAIGYSSFVLLPFYFIIPLMIVWVTNMLAHTTFRDGIIIFSTGFFGMVILGYIYLFKVFDNSLNNIFRTRFEDIEKAKSIRKNKKLAASFFILSIISMFVILFVLAVFTT